jgi:hypothetical protein
MFFATYIAGMKKIIAAFLMIFPLSAVADGNPMFGAGHDNSVTVHVAQGTGPGTLFKLVQPGLWKFEPMTLFMAQYSQPITIFRLPARQNLHLAQNAGYRADRGLSFVAAGISWDAALINWRGFYAGIGLGPYMRDSHDRRVSSRLVFGEKVFIGKNLGDRWRAELFTLHFSNGNFTSTNHGYNYSGLAVGYSF